MALIVALVVTGCAESEPLPPPGAHGPIRLWRWEPGREVPITLLASSLRQTGGRPGSRDAVLDLDKVRLRVPFADGVAEVVAPNGRYAADGDPEAELPAPDSASGIGVRLVVAIRGVPGIGWASRAWIAGDGTGPYLENVELVHAGLHTRHDRAAFADRGLNVSGQGRSRSAPVAVATALAALPSSVLAE
jgi:hypothetical protein